MKNKIISIFLVVIFIFSCKKKEINQEENKVKDQNENIVILTEAQLKNAKLEFGKLQEKDISSVLKVNGIIDVPPQNKISISAILGGYLKSTNLMEGMFVRKGEIIAQMEVEQFIQLQQEYLLAKAKMEYASLDLKRQKELNEGKAVSDKAFQMAQTEYNTQNILLNSYSKKLQMLGVNPLKLNSNSIQKTVAIYSPINGYVSKVNVNIGKYVLPSDVMFELINPEDIHLALNIFEKDIENIKIGQTIVSYTNNNSKKYNAEIILIGKELSQDRSVQVHCHFEKYDHNLLPGMYMNAEIEIHKKMANSLVEESILGFEAKNFVFISKSKTQFEMIEVKTGEKENGFIEILNFEDLKGKNIVTKNAYTLLMTLKNKAEEE